ncbi:Eco57I restriction-modification methylase domain-containing protein [Mycoplasma sp. AC157]
MTQSYKKKSLGQYFTQKNSWLKKQVLDFIKLSNRQNIYDPFAGHGDIFSTLKEWGYCKFIGLDIDNKLEYEINDSLLFIPYKKDSIIVTNPPYLAKNSATRMKIDYFKYFSNNNYDDLYLIALEKMLEANDYVVAIIPESFLHSNFKFFNKLKLVTIIEENPFVDTEVPICVVCFDSKEKDLAKIDIYKGEKKVWNLKEFFNFKFKPNKKINIEFNNQQGWLGLRAIDSTNKNNLIKFAFKENIDYDWKNKISTSSRHISLIKIDIQERKKEKFIELCNLRLNYIREKTNDLILTAFKGNRKDGIRRRRLDFKLARWIMEECYKEIENDW